MEVQVITAANVCHSLLTAAKQGPHYSYKLCQSVNPYTRIPLFVSTAVHRTYYLNVNQQIRLPKARLMSVAHVLHNIQVPYASPPPPNFSPCKTE
jgi:hypothetical protein